MPGLLHRPLRWFIATLLVLAVAVGPAVSAGHAADRACAGDGDALVHSAQVQHAAAAVETADFGRVASCQGHCSVLPEAVRILDPRTHLAGVTPRADSVALEWLAPVETGPPRV